VGEGKMTKSIVAVVRTVNNYSDIEKIEEAIQRTIDLSGGLDLAQKYDRMIVKINLCDFRDPGTGAITHPLFLDAFLKCLRDAFPSVEIYVVESDATVARPNLFIKWFGFDHILEKWKAKWMNLSQCRTVRRRIEGRYFSEIDVPEIFENSFFITLPKLKTSSVTKITCALKNQLGCLPYPDKIKFHKRLDDVIVDANLAFRPNFCLVDGVIGMVGTQGPAFGVPKRMGLVIAGADPVAVDSFCAKILGFNPYFIGHVRKASRAGLGSLRYTVVGDLAHDLKIDAEWSYAELMLMKVAQWLRNRSRRR
jgi:uncharacterized protein (DUF362 family)